MQQETNKDYYQRRREYEQNEVLAWMEYGAKNGTKKDKIDLAKVYLEGTYSEINVKKAIDILKTIEE